MAQQYTSLGELAIAVAQNPDLEARFKENPSAAIASVAGPQIPDIKIYRLVVGALGAALLLAILGAIVLAWKENSSNSLNLLTALGSAAVGALAGLLAPSPQKSTS